MESERFNVDNRWILRNVIEHHIRTVKEIITFSLDILLFYPLLPSYHFRSQVTPRDDALLFHSVLVLVLFSVYFSFELVLPGNERKGLLLFIYFLGFKIGLWFQIMNSSSTVNILLYLG